MIKQNKLSLTKKLDGGYLHVKKSPKKAKMNKGGYTEYLNKIKNGECNSSKKHGGSINKGNKKVISVKLKSPKKRVSAKKETKDKKQKVKDIPNIIPKRKSLSNKKNVPIVQAPAPEPQGVVSKTKKNPEVKKGVVVKQSGIKLQGPKTNTPLKKQRVLKRSSGKSKGRRINKSLTKRRGGSHHKRGKRISVTKVRRYSNKDISKIQSRLKDIKKKSDKQIKEELEKRGVKLSGKSPSIMKDVYMYSQLCGINIKRE